MGQQRLKTLTMLSTEKEVIHGLLDFDKRVIAQMKDWYASFLFKKWTLVSDPLFVISCTKKVSFFNYILFQDIEGFVPLYLVHDKISYKHHKNTVAANKCCIFVPHLIYHAKDATANEH